MRPVRSTAAHKTGRLGELVCSNSLKSESENYGALAAEGGTAPARFSVVDGRPEGARTRRPRAHRRSRRLRPGDHARDRSRIRASSCGAKKRHPSPDDGITIVATGPLTSGPLAEEIGRITGAERLYFYDSHQPDRRRRVDRSRDRVSRLPLRQVARRQRRLSELPVRPRAIRAVRGCTSRSRSRSRAHSRRPDAVLRGMPADRRTGAARPRHAALRADEAGGPDRPAHRPAALCGGATPPGEPARGQLQPGRFSKPHAVRRAGAHLPDDSRASKTPSSCATDRFIATRTSTRRRCSTPTLQLRARPPIFFAGQISGVEGYVESIATGLVAGRHAAELAARRATAAIPARDRYRLVVRLRFGRRSAKLPAG